MDLNADEDLRSDAILTSIATAAQRVAGDADWHPPVAALLARLAALMRASAAYVDRSESDADGTYRQVGLLHWPPVTIARAGAGRDAAIQAWGEAHAMGEIVHDTTANLPSEMRPWLDARGVKAVLQVPILVRGMLWGVIGLASGEARQWSETEIAALSTAASVIGIAVDRTQSTTLLREVIDSLDASVVVYDADDRYALGNRRYHQRYPHLPPDEELVGRSFEDMIRAGISAGITGQSTEMVDIESWIEERIRQWREARDGVEVRRDGDGSWTMLRTTRTADGKTVTLRYDISEQKRIEQELEAAKEEAAAKQAILARMSRDVRPLLASVATDLDRLSQSELEPDQLRLAAGAAAASERLLSVVDAILGRPKDDR